jgi:polyphosphate kinase 2
MNNDSHITPEKAKLTRKEYEGELRKLQVELCKLQDWVKREGLRIIVIFEGRDAAGKGGTIHAITERVSPRVFRVVALPAPSDREKTQMYMQRYMQHFPAAGEIVIFDRSWYNRAGVEYVMGFCSKEEHRRFLDICSTVEGFIVDAGVRLIKFWLEVGDEEQKRRFEARIDDPLRQWCEFDSPASERFWEPISGFSDLRFVVMLTSLLRRVDATGRRPWFHGRPPPYPGPGNRHREWQQHAERTTERQFLPILATRRDDGRTSAESDWRKNHVAVSRAGAVLHAVGNRERALSCGVPFIEKLARRTLPDANAERRTRGDPLPVPVGKDSGGSLAKGGHTSRRRFLDLAILSPRKIDVEVDGESIHRTAGGGRKDDDHWRDL